MEYTNQPVVIDNGSGSIKAGIAGEEKPRVLFPNYIGRPKYTRVMASTMMRESYVGSDAQKYRGILSLRYPMKHGIVTNWSDMQQIWEYAYSPEQLNCKSSEHPVLLSEAPLNPVANREKAMEIFFETFNAPAIHVQMQAVLSLYAAGRTTGVVLDSGDGVSHCVPVYEGFAIEPAVQRIDVAGRDVTRYLNELLRREGHIFHRTSEFEIVREIKEKVCQVNNSVKDVKSKDDKESKFYTMPDGSTIKISSAYWQAPEALFRPDLIGLEYPGVSTCIVNAIRESDYEIRKELMQSILLSGGSTMFAGFGERVLQDVKKAFHQQAQPHGQQQDKLQEPKIKISAPADRLSCTWTGGSILATLDTFHRVMKTKAQYENEGKNLARKAY
ncbi:Arp-1 [Aphelenchoides besseyi]|nr:Arp-1 [Aphelenchoides besseyi]KAI6211617.1 Arp-1 [Aphelenchoides besseyi]